MNSRFFRLSAAAMAPLFCLAFTANAHAADIGTSKKTGVGVGGGTATSGITGKMYLGPTTAIQGFVGLHGSNGTSLGVDYILEMPDLAAGSAGRVLWGAGAGAGVLLYSVGNNSATVIGVSGIVQLGWHFNAFPLEIIADWRPTFWIGDFFGGLNLGGGGGAIRWFF